MKRKASDHLLLGLGVITIEVIITWFYYLKNKFGEIEIKEPVVTGEDIIPEPEKPAPCPCEDDLDGEGEVAPVTSLPGVDSPTVEPESPTPAATE